MTDTSQHGSVGERGTAQAVHIRSSEGTAIWTAGDTYTLKARSADTGGVLSLFEAAISPGGGPPPHRHLRADEAYYVLFGELEVLMGERTRRATAGDVVFLPRGTVHRFKNVGVEPARLIILFAPAGFEGFFLDVGQPARPGEPAPSVGPEEMARLERFSGVYGIEVFDEHARQP
jgi:quercetin dioxygenase-like cupin family protein